MTGMVRALALAGVVAALAGAAATQQPCPTGVLCAALSSTSAEDLALMPEACLESFAAEAAAARRAGFNAIAVATELPPRNGEPDRVPPSALARGLASASVVVERAGLRPVVRLEGRGARGGCRSRAASWFVQAYRRARSDRSGWDAGRSNVYCASDASPTLSGLAPRFTTAPALDTLVESDDLPASAAPAAPLRAAGARSPYGVADFTRTGRAAAGIDGDASLVGYISRLTRNDDPLANGRFARGWDAWETRGPVALEVIGKSANAAHCAGLTARLDPGASISQAVRSIEEDRGVPALDLRLAVEAVPARRRLIASLGGSEREIDFPAGAGVGTTTFSSFDLGPRQFQLRLQVPDAAGVPVRIRSVHLSGGTRSGWLPESDRVAVHEWLTHRKKRHLGWEHAPQAEADDGAGIELVDRLGEARIDKSDEAFVRVASVRLDDGTGRRGILAHPGSSMATSLTWRLPPSSCLRRFHAEIALASGCRGIGDGIEFEASSGTQHASALIRGDAGEPQRLDLDLDAPGQGEGEPGVELTLRTRSGARGDARCDWATWVEPEVSCAVKETSRRTRTRPVSRTLDVRAMGPGARFDTRWDELNVWKLYTFFGPERARSAALSEEPGWLRRIFPWVTHVRVLAAAGGNSCRHIRDLCLRGEESADHPFRGRCWEGADGRAARYEILKDDVGAERLDFTTWRAAIDDLLASGVLPHLNISAAPCALTGGHEYAVYHWNQRPVVRHDAWRSFVGGVAREIAAIPGWPAWRFSITNEPNCLWIDPAAWRPGAGPTIRRLGFVGDSHEYAAHLAETAASLRTALPGVRIQLGNYTIGGKYPLEDDLPEYLGALPAALALERLAPSDFSAIAFSLYETAQHGLAEMPAYKFGRLRRWITADSPFHELPLKLDEVEIHPLVADAFEKTTGTPIDRTRWAAAWHADLLALAIEERVISVAPWLGRLFADGATPSAKFWVYALAAIAAGDAVPVDGDLLHPGALRPRREDEERHLLVAVHRAAGDPDGLGYLVTRDPVSNATWVLVWRHDGTPLPDAAADRGEPLAFHVRASDAPPRPVELLEIGARAGGAVWDPAPFGVSPVLARQSQVEDGDVIVALPPESVHLLRFAR